MLNSLNEMLLSVYKQTLYLMNKHIVFSIISVKQKALNKN